MKMVSSAKLKKAQTATENIILYQKRLDNILNACFASETEFHSAYEEVRIVQKLAIVVFSSNSSLCGAFNSNVIKKLNEIVHLYKESGVSDIVVFPIGKKIHEATKKLRFTISGSYQLLAEKPNFDETTKIANTLIDKFLKKEFDKIIVIYHHLKSTAVQKLFVEDFLPINFNKKESSNKIPINGDYIVEPNRIEILQTLLPKTLRTKLYACLLDSNASEHGARVVAMQIATDNADDLIRELTIIYNKTRQQTITSELLDIVGGISALKSGN